MSEEPKSSGGQAQCARSRRSALSVLAGLVILTLLIRGGFLAATPHALDSDPDGYRHLAENVAERGVFGYGDSPTAYRPPLYPLVLAPLVSMPYTTTAIATLHVLLGVATVGLLYRLAGRWGLRSFSAVAAVLVVVDPLLLMQSTLVMSETLAALLVVVALLALTGAAQRPTAVRAALAGGAVALASLCRPTFLPWLALCAVVLPWFAETWNKRLRNFTIYLVAAAAVLAPWITRNYIHFGRPVAGTTHGGYTLLLANNPWFYDYLRSGEWGSVWAADELDQWWMTKASRATPAKELQADRRAYEKAWETIRRQPGMFLYACLVRVGRLWSPLPHRVDPQEQLSEQVSRYTVGLWYGVELVLALVGVVAVIRQGCPPRLQLCRPSAPGSHRSPSWRRTWMWGILLAIVFTAVHSVYWSNLRMRAPLMPLVAMAAVLGGDRLRARFKADSNP